MNSDEKHHNGPIEPGSSGRWGEPVPFDEAIENIVNVRREWASRPEEIERQQLVAAGHAAREVERRRAKGKDVLYGPPDPRKGRLPMTR